MSDSLFSYAQAKKPSSVLPGARPLNAPQLPGPALPQEEPEEDIGYRTVDDIETTRRSIFDNALNAITTLKPIANNRHILRLSGAQYIDPDYYDLKAQKQAIIGGQSLGRRVAGTWELVDKATGKVLDAKKMTVARVPFMTDRGTVINNGVEYTISNQLRMRPGIFTRVKENGEIEAHANILPGDGVSHRYFLDPEKSTFHMRLHQSKLPLIPLLRAMGATDKELREAWGDTLFNANKSLDTPANLAKIFDKLLSPRDKAAATDKAAALAALMNSMRVERGVMKRTLQLDTDRLSKEAILATTKKLLAVSRGEQEIDDRDNLAFQTVHGPEDLFTERLAKDYGRMQRNLLFKSSFKGNLSSVPPGALTKQIETVLVNSGLAQPLEEVNPAEILDRFTRITKMGEGGLSSLASVPDESRSVQPGHFFFIDPTRTPESERVGIDLYLASSVRKGKNGELLAPFTELKTGRQKYLTAAQVESATVTTPDELQRKTKRVLGLRNGVMDWYPRNEITHVKQDFNEAFSPLAHFVPGISGASAQRMSMGSRMATQALSLVKGEAPLVRSKHRASNSSYEALYGKYLGAKYADRAGRVLDVQPDELTVRYEDGTKAKIPLYNNFVLNRKSGLHNTPLVQPGDKFQPGQLLAKSNFTDDQGVSALGVNARVGYMADKGYNFEDAIRISESLADRLTSEHMYQHAIDLDNRTKTGRKAFVSLFPSIFTRKQLDNIDDEGVIKPGTEVRYGDPLILGARERDTAYGKIHRKGKPLYNDISERWEHSNPGIVTDVFKQGKAINVVVKSTARMQVGDKLAFRYGDKSVVSDIVPDHKMPVAADGKPLEILCNPLSVISRGNPIQVIEVALGKIAEKTGKHYDLDDFASLEAATDFAERELRKHDLTDLEDVTDPETGRKIPQVLVGNRFLMKLSHMAEDKLQGRAFGGYTADETPSKGGPEGSKQIGLLLMNALLSHGANNVVWDAAVVRGQSNPDYWLQVMSGHGAPAPRVPKVYRKFVEQLRGAGINVVEDGPKTHIMAMTNKDIDQLAENRNINSGETLDFARNMEPIKGGLFDITLTGGPNGNRWSAIQLHTPLPNPVMEEPIRQLLGLTRQGFLDVLGGRQKLPNGQTGPQGLQAALGALNLDNEIKLAQQDIESGRKGRRDTAVRKLKYLKAAKKLDIHPREWIIDRVPVLPPLFRPISLMQGKSQPTPLVADANYLYKELLDANKNLEEAQGYTDDTSEELHAVYDAMRAVVGLGDPTHPKLREKHVKGLLAQIFGSSPKSGTVQRKLIGSAVDLVGRAVITPDPDLDMDSVGLPIERAWNVYKPFIARRLRRRGMRLSEALQQIEERTDLAKNELLREMSVRPLLIDRAPAWHKFSTLAFWPKLVKYDTLRISPLVVKGFGADFDGDAMQYHVQADDEAAKEAGERLVPSANLLSAADFKTPMHVPGQEYTGGLYAASTRKSKAHKRTFTNLRAALEAFNKGNLGIDDEVELMS